jgi:hypothetical protein
MTLKVDWVRCSGNEWCRFNRLDLSHDYFKRFHGVYVLWFGDEPKTVLCVGHGNIGEQLCALTIRREIVEHQQFGLKVTWAAVGPDFREGVARYLAIELKPMIDDQITAYEDVAVNLPW